MSKPNQSVRMSEEKLKRLMEVTNTDSKAAAIRKAADHALVCDHVIQHNQIIQINLNEYLTIKQVAAMQQVDFSTVYNWVKKGWVRTKKRGKRGVLIEKESLEEFLSKDRDRPKVSRY